MKVNEIKIISEIENVKTTHGNKPTGLIEFKHELATLQKEMRFNQTFINYLIDKSESTDSKKWNGMIIKVEQKEIMGHLATIPA